MHREVDTIAETGWHSRREGAAAVGRVCGAWALLRCWGFTRCWRAASVFLGEKQLSLAQCVHVGRTRDPLVSLLSAIKMLPGL